MTTEIGASGVCAIEKREKIFKGTNELGGKPPLCCEGCSSGHTGQMPGTVGVSKGVLKGNVKAPPRLKKRPVRGQANGGTGRWRDQNDHNDKKEVR